MWYLIINKLLEGGLSVKLFQNLRSKRMFYRILFLLLSMVCVMFLISFLL